MSYSGAMRVLITRPEGDAAALAANLARRGHQAVIAPLFVVQKLAPPPDFAATLAACQAVLLTSANGAHALAEASEQRGKPVYAVGDATAATAEGLGFSDVTSAGGDATALAALVRERLAAAAGPLVHVSGTDVAPGLAETLAPQGFDVRRIALYRASEVAVLPESANAALAARALDAAAFFSPRAASVFARLVGEAGLAETCRSVTAVAISPAASEPLKVLPFKATLAAALPTRQAVLDMIDRLAEAGYQGGEPAKVPMSDPSSPPSAPSPAPVVVRRGLGFPGTFVVSLVVGLIAAALVLAAALFSLPYWPQEARLMWRGPPPTAPAPAADLAAAIDTSKREMAARLDDLDKRVRAAATTAAQADRPALSDAALANLHKRLDALEARANAPPPASAGEPDKDKDTSALRIEIASLRTALQTLDGTVVSQGQLGRTLAQEIEQAKVATGQAGADEKKALAAARASATIAIAARLGAALDSGLPLAGDLGLLAPLAPDDARIAALADTLRPLADQGVTGRAQLAAEFPAVARLALAEDVADDSFGQRLLGKLRGLVSLRRVGADVAGDSVEAKLARAEAALNAGEIAKAAELVKALPAPASRATSAWLARAEKHLAAQAAVDQLAAHAVGLLGAAR